MEDIVTPGEPIARFIRSHSHMRLGLGKPKFLAFMPRVANGDISVYRIAGLDVAAVVSLGAGYVASPNSPVKGHCVQLADNFFAEQLNIEAAPNPHLRHANVVGWTSDPKNRITAHKLADKAELTVY
jgi:hypothetical protein